MPRVAAPAGARRINGGFLVHAFAENRMLSLAAINIALIAAMAPFFPHTFFAFDNFSTILLSCAVEDILAVGMMFLIVAGEFDLSIGSTYALAGTVAAVVMKTYTGLPIPVGMAAGLAVAVFVGVCNGLLVEKAGVNALIATLATMMVGRAVAMNLGGGALVDLPRPFVNLGQASQFGLRMPVYYMLMLVAAGSVLLSRHRFFRQFYLIGGNRRSAVLSGVKVAPVMIANFAIMGLIAGIAGEITAARMNYIIGSAGDGLNLRILTAVIIGGGSLAGGRGTVGGALMGVLFLGLLQNIMVMLGIPANAQLIVTGAVLVIAVVVDVVLQRRYR